MESERIQKEEQEQVSGGLTEARQQELDNIMQHCRDKHTPLETVLRAMVSQHCPTEEILYVRVHY